MPKMMHGEVLLDGEHHGVIVGVADPGFYYCQPVGADLMEHEWFRISGDRLTMIEDNDG